MKKRQHLVKSAAAIVIVLAAAAAAYKVLGSDRPLNVILISIDTLRPDRMGLFGHRPNGRSTTPSLDKLAAEGAWFTNAVSTTSWTLPAHYSLLTGVSDHVHGVIHDHSPRPKTLPMAAEIFKEAGYRTAGFFSGTYLNSFFGFNRGFDTYVGARTMMGADRPGRAMEFRAAEVVTSQKVSEHAMRFIREKGAEPFFLFLHYFDVHNEYLPPKPFDSLFGRPYGGWVTGKGVTSDPRYTPDMNRTDLDRLRALYDGEIGWVDSNIGRLLQQIKSHSPDLFENTLVVVTSDHGEEFFEHGELCHQNNLYESSVRIPLIVSCPARIGKGTKIDTPARIYDIVPTILDYAGLEIPEVVEGRSLRPAIDEEDAQSRPALLELARLSKETGYDQHFSLRLGNHKLIVVQVREWSKEKPYDLSGAVLDERYELYDLLVDPEEKQNLADEKPDIVARMMGTLQTLLAESDRKRAEIHSGDRAGEGAIPEDLKESLRGLGYGGGGQ